MRLFSLKASSTESYIRLSARMLSSSNRWKKASKSIARSSTWKRIKIFRSTLLRRLRTWTQLLDWRKVKCSPWKLRSSLRKQVERKFFWMELSRALTVHRSIPCMSNWQTTITDTWVRLTLTQSNWIAWNRHSRKAVLSHAMFRISISLKQKKVKSLNTFSWLCYRITILIRLWISGICALWRLWKGIWMVLECRSAIINSAVWILPKSVMNGLQILLNLSKSINMCKVESLFKKLIKHRLH